MQSVAFIQWCLDHLNYWTVTLLMAIESSFIPFPSEVIVPPAAYKAAAPGSELNLIGVIACATLGANLGALANYYLALWIGRPLVYRFAGSRLGHLCLLSIEKVQKAESFFYHHGSLSTFVGRLIPAIRQLISIPAGLARMRLSKFILYTTLGAGIWNSILALMGYYLASVIPEDQLLTQVTRYSHEIGYLFIAIGIAIVVYFIVQARKKPRTLHDT